MILMGQWPMHQARQERCARTKVLEPHATLRLPQVLEQLIDYLTVNGDYIYY